MTCLINVQKNKHAIPPLSVSQFETVGEAENSGTLQTASCHTVNRRYSEFLNLQTRLEDNPEVKRVIKSKDARFPETEQTDDATAKLA